MPKYLASFREYRDCFKIIYAENENQAYQIAKDTDDSLFKKEDFEYVNDSLEIIHEYKDGEI